MFTTRIVFESSQAENIFSATSPNLDNPDLVQLVDQSGAQVVFKRSGIEYFELSSDAPSPSQPVVAQGVLYFSNGMGPVALSVTSFPDITQKWFVVTSFSGPPRYYNSDIISGFRLTKIG